jgi:AcrR family transcriptional regulator
MATVRKRLTAEDRRAVIVEAALAVFSRRGYHLSAIDDIACEVGVSKALIYEHFASKQELYADLLERNAGELFERLEGAVAAVEVEAGASRLATRLDVFFAFVEKPPRRLAHPLPERGRPGNRRRARPNRRPDHRRRGGADRPRSGRPRPRRGRPPGCSRERRVEMVMDFTWLGLKRLKQGRALAGGGVKAARRLR